MSIRYLLDENLPPQWRRPLLRLAPTLVVRYIGEPGTPARQSPDSLLLQWCEDNDFILVTNNRHTMPAHLKDHLAAGRHVPGVFILTANLSVRRLLLELVLIAGASFEKEYQDQLLYLPLT